VVAAAPVSGSSAPPRGGTLVWTAVLAVAAGGYAVGLASGQAKVLLAAGLLLAVPLMFAWRLEAGVLLLVLARPSLDVFADRTLASAHGVKLNPASVLAVLTIAIAVPYMIERWHELRRAPAIVPYLVFAAIAAVGIAFDPAGSAPTEWLRLCAVLVTYPLVYLAASQEEDGGKRGGEAIALLGGEADRELHGEQATESVPASFAPALLEHARIQRAWSGRAGDR